MSDKVANVLKDRGIIIFMAKQRTKICRSTLNMKAQRNIPDSLNVQEHRCESLEAREYL